MEQAVILAGGQATRLRPFTDDRPKAMVEVAGSPIVEHQIRWLHDNGVDDIVISCGYRAEVMMKYLGDGDLYGTQLSYAVEETPLGRGGGLKFAARSLAFPDQRWVAVNGDVLCDFPLSELEGQHEQLGVTATIALAEYQTSWGIADLDGDLIRGFVEKPKLPYWINAGVYCFEPGLTDLLPDEGDHEDSTFPKLAMEGKLGAYKIRGYWQGIDTVKDINQAAADLQAR
ncbi:MAG: nucleotidyltransferase family protein [Actinobacteria bacterium]|nr:nucleotidyltransferase family protein [Actinomycetota bacterium]